MEWAGEARMNKSNNSLKRLVGLVAFCCAAAGSQAAETVVIGPVEQIANRGSSITVLGQTFRVSPARTSELDIGAYAAVVGEQIKGRGLVAKTVKLLDAAYVPGASQVYLSGTVDRYSNSIGLVQIGSQKILISDAFAASSAPAVVVGEPIELVGTQALAGGTIWATDIAIQETTKRAIQGTGAITLAIQGTGKRAIQGTGVNTLATQGTGAQAQAIQGTGKRAIQGTGANTLAIQGTGVQALAIQGTGKRAIQGTGARAIQGTGKLAIQGTGIL
jgi:hypothetical protein